MVRLLQFFFSGMVILILGSVTYGFAASSSQVNSAGGEGATGISGWVVSEIRYQLAKDPAYLTGVEFDLNGKAGTVKVKLVSTDTAYASCLSPQGNHWVCETPGLTVVAVDELRVIALDH